MVALNVLVEFGAFTLLRFRTFTTELFVEYRTGFNGPGASLLAVVLLVLCLLCLFAELRVRGSAQYSRIGRGTRRPVTRHSLGWALVPVLIGFVGLVVVTLGVPLGMIVYWLTQHGSAAISPVEVSASLLFEATIASLGLGLAGGAVTVALALPLGFLAVRYRGPLVTLLERTAYLAQGVPGIVVALALISLTVHNLRPLYQSTLLLILAYAIIFLPLALVSVRAALVQVQPMLEEAGRSLGLGWAAVAWRILLPLAGPGIGAAAALVFVSVVTELTTTLLLAPIGTQTLATQVGRHVNVGVCRGGTLCRADGYIVAAVDLAGRASSQRCDFSRVEFAWRTCISQTWPSRSAAKPCCAMSAWMSRPAGCGDSRQFRQWQDDVAAAGLRVRACRCGRDRDRWAACRRPWAACASGAAADRLRGAGRRAVPASFGGRQYRVRPAAPGAPGSVSRGRAAGTGGTSREFCRSAAAGVIGRRAAAGGAGACVGGKARLVLLDEPFSALDAALRAETRTAVTAALAAADATAVLVTHDQAEALSMGHEVAVLREGRLVQVSDPVTLYRHPRDAALASFVGEVMVVRGEVRGARVTCALGELALASFTQDGPADVLVRPEQVRLDADPQGADPQGHMVRAQVCAVAFYGHDALAELKLLPASGVQSVSARVAGYQVPAPGTVVGLSVEGEVTAFPIDRDGDDTASEPISARRDNAGRVAV